MFKFDIYTRTYKLLVFLILLVHEPLEVCSDGKLQQVADIVKNMKTSRLCEYNCEPEVKVNGSNLTISFKTTLGDNVDASKFVTIQEKFPKMMSKI